MKAGLDRNDLLPPRPDDRAGGEVGTRFVAALQHAFGGGTYEADRAILVPVPKPRYATRPAALMTLADRIVFHALVDPLRARIERGLSSTACLFWPRAEESNKRWPEFEQAPLTVDGGYVVVTDVSGFYESVDHGQLGSVLIALTGKTSVVEALIGFLDQVMGSGRGLPQGVSASDVLATAYLSQVDASMLRSAHHYWRHGDDVRMAVADHDDGRRAIHRFEAELRSVGLLLNAEKTRVLHRATYEAQSRAIESERARVRDALLAQREKGLLTAEDDEIEAIMVEAGVDEQTQWDLFYHASITIDEIVEQLRPVLQPGDVDVAVGVYEEAIRRAPGGDADDALTPEMFHGLLTTSFTKLIAAGHSRPLQDAVSLALRFPDKTELIATYLLAMASTHSGPVVAAASAVLSNGYTVGWQQAWMLQVIRKALASSPTISVAVAVKTAARLATDEDASWLARAESVRLLAHAGSLKKTLLLRLWAAAPAVVRADLASAVAALSILHAGDNPWATAFVDSLAADPMLQVVLARTREQIAL